MIDKELVKKAVEYRIKLVPYTELGYPDVEIPVYSALQINEAYIAGTKELEKENHQLKQQLENEKQLNAEIKKRLVEVEYDCKEFNHEYCDPNCNGKRKETIDLSQLISDGLNETLLKQKDTEIEQLKQQIKDLESQLKDVIEDNDYYQKENEKMKNHTNCKFYHEWNLANVMDEPLDDLSPCQGCKNFSLWELAE